MYLCFVDPEKAFDTVPRKVVEFGMRKREIPEMMLKAVISLYKKATTDQS